MRQPRITTREWELLWHWIFFTYCSKPACQFICKSGCSSLSDELALVSQLSILNSLYQLFQQVECVYLCFASFPSSSRGRHIMLMRHVPCTHTKKPLGSTQNLWRFNTPHVVKDILRSWGNKRIYHSKLGARSRAKQGSLNQKVIQGPNGSLDITWCGSLGIHIPHQHDMILNRLGACNRERKKQSGFWYTKQSMAPSRMPECRLWCVGLTIA